MLIKFFFRLCCVLLLCGIAFPNVVAAQETSWRETRTEKFVIVYAPEDEATAQQYVTFVDGVYDEITAIFGHPTTTPITLRLYPTLESYYAVNPLARGMTGIVAHADYQRREVVVIVPQTRSQTEEEIENNVRHELTHIVATELSDERLNVLFQEGIAQYVEHPSGELETRISLLQRAVDSQALPRWSQLDDRDTFYATPEVNYPVSLSIVAFLVERKSFSSLRDLLVTTAQSSGYRSALERTYGVSAETLEQEWQAWLPSYLAGGYRHNALTAYDLSRVKALLAQGDYAAAAEELNSALAWLQQTNQTEVLAEAQTLLTNSQHGQMAEQLATQAHDALAANDYATAQQLVNQAQEAFAAIGDQRQSEVLAEYAARAQRGLDAETALREAAALANSFRYPSARAKADQALSAFVALGNTEQAQRAAELRSVMDQRQSLFGMLLLIFGIVGALASVVRRIVVREVEAW